MISITQPREASSAARIYVRFFCSSHLPQSMAGIGFHERMYLLPSRWAHRATSAQGLTLIRRIPGIRNTPSSLLVRSSQQP